MRSAVNWRLLAFMCGAQGWVLTIPLFGPMLFPMAAYRHIDAQPMIPIFLLCLALSFVAWGVGLSRLSASKLPVRRMLAGALGGCLALGLSLLWLPGGLWIPAFALMGVLGSLPSLLWLFIVSRSVEGRRLGWNLGITGLFTEAVVKLSGICAQLVHPAVGYLLAHVLLLVSAAMLLVFPAQFNVPNAPRSRRETRGWRSSAYISFLILVFVVYLVSGVMYQVVTPFLGHFPTLNMYDGVLPYVAVMPFAGWLADRRGTRPLISFGIAGLGLSYTLFAVSSGWWTALVGSILIFGSFALLDLFVLFVPALRASGPFRLALIGGSLGVYILSILTGVWFTDWIVRLTRGNYLLAFLSAIFVLFLAFLLIDSMVRDDRPDPERSSYYEAIAEELQLAGTVQRGLFPTDSDFPHHLEIAVASEAAKEVGGDFYDVIALGDSKSLLVIGDVMGEGLPAALMVSSILGQIRSEVHSLGSIVDILNRVNHVLIRDARASMAVTLGIVLLDSEAGRLTFANAGHPFPYIVRKGDLHPVENASMPLGVDEEAAYSEVDVPFRDEDQLVLYTDGLLEVRNVLGELYGFDRFESSLLRHTGSASPEEYSRRIVDDVKSFAGEPLHMDDMTLLLVRKGRVHTHATEQA